MDYLTNYYKNLCEQLQERVNQLQNILNEGRVVKDPVTGKWTMVGRDLDGSGFNPARYSNIKLSDPKNAKNIIPGTPQTELDRLNRLRYMGDKVGGISQETETDEDIIRMRQTAADQGGIPQDMVNEPIERTKQLPDGRTIRSKTVQPPKVRPNIGGAGPMIPKKPLPYPTPAPKGETMIPKVLDGFKKEQEFDNRMGIIPQTPEQRKRFGMTPYDNRMS